MAQRKDDVETGAAAAKVLAQKYGVARWVSEAQLMEISNAVLEAVDAHRKSRGQQVASADFESGEGSTGSMA